jgi:hypothetical protein
MATPKLEMLPDQSWLRPPNVSAPDPDNRANTLNFEVSQDFILGNFSIFRRSPIFWMWCHVVGELPPINNVERLRRASPTPSLTTLHQAVACFRGLERPHDKEQDGASVVVYVLRPPISIEYEGDMVCMAKAKIVPADTVLTVQMCLTRDLQSDSKGIQGIITRVEFVTSDGVGLPLGWQERYKTSLW